MKRATLFLLVTSVLTTVFGIAGAPPAHACSCVQIDALSLSDADAVVVGTVTAVNALPSPDEWDRPFVATINVERDLNENVADVVYVRSYEDDGGNCGWSMTVGDQISAVLYENEGELRTDGCSWVGDDVIDNFAPFVNRPGSAEVIVGLWANSMRTIAYDADGVPFAFGFEPGVVHRIAVCEDGQSIVELVRNRQGSDSRLAVRRLADFAITVDVPLQVDGSELFAFELGCRGDATAPVLTVAGRLVTESESVRDVWTHDGEAWTRSEGAAEPTPVAIQHEPFWPELVTSRGVRIPASDAIMVAVELNEPTQVDPVGQAPEPRQLGKGTPPNDVEPTPTPEPVAPAPPADEAPPAEVAAEPDPANETADADDGPPRWIPFVSIFGAALIVGIVVSVVRGRREDPAPPDHGSRRIGGTR